MPLNKTAAIRSHQARRQAQQTVMPRPHPDAALRGFCLAVLAGETGSDKQGVD
jgi:hypothetical protein